MKRVSYECDKCGQPIKDVVYKLTCFAKPVINTGRIDHDAAAQNDRQNMALQDHESRHLCKRCKDGISTSPLRTARARSLRRQRETPNSPLWLDSSDELNRIQAPPGA